MVKRFVQTDDTGRILASSEDGNSIPNSIEFDFPDDFDFSKQDDYKIVDNGSEERYLQLDVGKNTLESELNEPQSYLYGTDYITSKFVERFAQCTNMEEMLKTFQWFNKSYSKILDKRQQCRDDINDLNDIIRKKNFD